MERTHSSVSVLPIGFLSAFKCTGPSGSGNRQSNVSSALGCSELTMLAAKVDVLIVSAETVPSEERLKSGVNKRFRHSSIEGGLFRDSGPRKKAILEGLVRCA